MTSAPRAVLRLKAKVTPAGSAPSPKPEKRHVLPPRSAVRDLAALGLPLFQKMHELGTMIPMKVGIYKDMLAATDPAQHKAMKKLLGNVARSRAYQTALAADGAMRCDLQGNPVEPVSCRHRELALVTIDNRHKASRSTPK